MDTIVVMKLLAGRTQDLADVEAIVASGADRDLLREAVRKAAPDRVEALERLLARSDGARWGRSTRSARDLPGPERLCYPPWPRGPRGPAWCDP